MDYYENLSYAQTLKKYIEHLPQEKWQNQEEYYLLRSKYIHLRMLCIYDSFLFNLPTPDLKALTPSKHSEELVDAVIDNCIHKFELANSGKWVYTLSNPAGFVVGKATSKSKETAKEQAVNNAKSNITFAENYAKQMGYTS